MNSEPFQDDRNLTSVIIKPLYFGMAVNVMLPLLLLVVCYYLSGKYYIPNRSGDLANTLFYLFGVFALAEAALAFWWRHELFKRPMIRKPETFETDFPAELLSRARKVFLLIASISLWGYAYFFISGRFSEAVFFIVFSFVVFQIVRPRYRSVRKLIDYQKKLVEQGKLLGY